MRPIRISTTNSRPHGPQRERTDRARRITGRHVWPRSKSSATSHSRANRSGGLASSLGGRRWRVGAGHPHRMAFSPARQGSGDGRCLTLALGIGANAAIFSVVREVLLRPLVNRDEDRLIYIRQRAPGLGAENTAFSVPEIDDFKSRVSCRQRLRRLLHDRVPPRRLRRAHGCRRVWSQIVPSR